MLVTYSENIRYLRYLYTLFKHHIREPYLDYIGFARKIETARRIRNRHRPWKQNMLRRTGKVDLEMFVRLCVCLFVSCMSVCMSICKLPSSRTDENKLSVFSLKCFSVITSVSFKF